MLAVHRNRDAIDVGRPAGREKDDDVADFIYLALGRE